MIGEHSAGEVLDIAPKRLGSEGDFRNEANRLFPSFEELLNRGKVDFSFPRTRDSVDEMNGERGRRRGQNFVDDVLLGRGESKGNRCRVMQSTLLLLLRYFRSSSARPFHAGESGRQGRAEGLSQRCEIVL